MNNNYIGQQVTVMIDRPLGSRHPEHDFVYEANYGYIPNTKSGDGEELDVYVLGIHEPLKEFKGTCIAIIHRLNDDDDKLVVIPEDASLTNEEIQRAVHFQEQWFDHEVLR